MYQSIVCVQRKCHPAQQEPSAGLIGVDHWRATHPLQYLDYCRPGLSSHPMDRLNYGSHTQLQLVHRLKVLLDAP